MVAEPSSENVNGVGFVEINLKRGLNVIFSMFHEVCHRHGSKGKISK